MRHGTHTFRSSSLRISAFEMPIKHAEHVRWISHVETDAEDRRKGNASRLLKRICREADESRVVLVLEPRTYGGEPAPDRNVLECWYTRHGFQRFQDEPCVMVRMPKR